MFGKCVEVMVSGEHITTTCHYSFSNHHGSVEYGSLMVTPRQWCSCSTGVTRSSSTDDKRKGIVEYICCEGNHDTPLQPSKVQLSVAGGWEE